MARERCAPLSPAQRLAGQPHPFPQRLDHGEERRLCGCGRAGGLVRPGPGVDPAPAGDGLAPDLGRPDGVPGPGPGPEPASGGAGGPELCSPDPRADHAAGPVGRPVASHGRPSERRAEWPGPGEPLPGRGGAAPSPSPRGPGGDHGRGREANDRRHLRSGRDGGAGGDGSSHRHGGHPQPCHLAGGYPGDPGEGTQPHPRLHRERGPHRGPALRQGSPALLPIRLRPGHGGGAPTPGLLRARKQEDR